MSLNPIFVSTFQWGRIIMSIFGLRVQCSWSVVQYVGANLLGLDLQKAVKADGLVDHVDFMYLLESFGS